VFLWRARFVEVIATYEKVATILVTKRSIAAAGKNTLAIAAPTGMRTRNVLY